MIDDNMDDLDEAHGNETHGDDRLRRLAERIQVGDADEGAEALRELVQDAQAGRRSVRDELADLQMEAENHAALDRFATRYKQVVDDPHMTQVATSILQDELIDDLKGVGLKDEEIASARGDIGRLAGLHGYARRKGLQVRNADDLLEETGRTLNRKFGIAPAPGRTQQELMADLRAKRGYKNDGTSGVSQEVVRAAHAARRAPVQPARPGASQRERQRAYIDALRKERGFRALD